MVQVLDPEEFDAFYAVYARTHARDIDGPWLAVEKKVNLTDDEYGTKVAVVEHDEQGVVVAGGTAILPLQDNTAFAFLDVFVDPPRQRRGIGSAVLEALLDVAREHGRTTVFMMPIWPVDSDGDAGRAFVEAHGFALDMMDAVRELALPADLPPLELDPAYTLHSWRGPCPPEWIEEYAELRRILTSEAPSGEAGLEDEFWDADRVRKDELDVVRARRQMQVTVARAPGGELAGHTQLSFPDSDEVYQWDTLVRRDHRGHGLGLALKIHAMHASADLLAGRRRITTENAASNSHMIAVNERLGFRQTAWTGEYVRDL